MVGRVSLLSTGRGREGRARERGLGEDDEVEEDEDETVHLSLPFTHALLCQTAQLLF